MAEHRTSHHHGDVCPASAAGMLDHPLRRLFQNPRTLLAGLVKPGMTVLDLGCGPGYFSLAMARMVGENGRVLAVDVQPEMLAILRAKAERQGLLPRLVLQPCEPGRIGLDQPIDFALAFYMLHETPDSAAFAREIFAALKPGGRFLVVEPSFVSADDFRETLNRVRSAGFAEEKGPWILLGRTRLFHKPG